MAQLKEWLHATRPNTLPASLSPVLMGIGASAAFYKQGEQHFSRNGELAQSAGILFSAHRPLGLSWFGAGTTYLVITALLCLLVALFLQVGVNFSNDYSDGVRGTDHGERLGPTRLTGSGGAAPKQVLRAALISFALAGLCGLFLVIFSGQYWFIGAGVAALLAAWFYTGGRKPYGYLAGISELMVFIFFGLMATLGTTWVQVFSLNGPVIAGASGVGLLSCALLMVNNLRDIPTDRLSGKLTLAVRLGDRYSRWVIVFYLLVAGGLGLYATWGWASLVFAVIYLADAIAALRPIIAGVTGGALIPSLKKLGLLTLRYGILLALIWVLYGI